MTTVSAGTSSTETLTAESVVSVSCDPNERAVIAVARGGQQIFSSEIAGESNIGPFNAGDVITVVANRGDVVYTVSAFVDETGSGGRSAQYLGTASDAEDMVSKYGSTAIVGDTVLRTDYNHLYILSSLPGTLDTNWFDTAGASPTFRGNVANESEMLALSAALTGDYCKRTDTNTFWFLTGVSYSTLGDWTNSGADTSTAPPAADDSTLSTISAKERRFPSLATLTTQNKQYVEISTGRIYRPNAGSNLLVQVNRPAGPFGEFDEVPVQAVPLTTATAIVLGDAVVYGVVCEGAGTLTSLQDGLAATGLFLMGSSGALTEGQVTQICSDGRGQRLKSGAIYPVIASGTWSALVQVRC